MPKKTAFECDTCGAQSLSLPKICELCKKKEGFSEVQIETSKDDPSISKKYDKAMKELDRYAEDCDPETLKYSSED